MRGFHKLTACILLLPPSGAQVLWCTKEVSSAFRLSHRLSRQLQASHLLSVFPAILGRIPPAVWQRRYMHFNWFTFHICRGSCWKWQWAWEFHYYCYCWRPADICTTEHPTWQRYLECLYFGASCHNISVALLPTMLFSLLSVIKYRSSFNNWNTESAHKQL